jgi:PAS domain S-box-containing protein
LKVIGTPKDSAFELNERSKELNCIYEVSNLLSKPDMNIDSLVDQIIYLIQSTMERPYLTSVRIMCREKNYQNQNFKKTAWKVSHKETVGVDDILIEVYNMEENQFSYEKINLIKEVGFLLKNFIDREDYGKLFEISNKNRIELEESERKFRFLYENAPLAYQSLDSEGNILDVNKAWLTFLGYERDEIIGKWFGDFIDPEYLNVFDIRFPKFKEEGEIKGVAYEIIKKDGNKALVSFNGKIGYDENMNFERTHCIFQDITEMKSVEENLRKSEEKYRRLIEDTIVGVWMIDSEFITKLVNPYMAEMLGYEIEEMLGESLFDFMTEKNKEIALQNLKKQQQGAKYIDIEFEFMHRNGTPIYTELRASTIFDDYGNSNGAFAFIIDITKEKKVEDELRLHSEIMTHMSEGVNLVRAIDQTIVYTNPRFNHMFGYNSGELSNKPVSILNAPSGKKPEELSATIKGQLRKKGEWHGEILNIKKDGILFWCYANISEFNHPDYGKVFISVHTNITERKKTEQKLIESEVKYRSLFEYAPISLWEEDFSELKQYLDHLKGTGIQDFRTFFDTNPEEMEKCVAMIKILNVNQKSLDLYKAKDKEELKVNLNQVFSKKSFEGFKEELMLLSKGVLTYETENITQTLNGEQVFINLTRQILPGFEENWSKVLISINDITNLKKTEQKLRESEEKYRRIFESIPDLFFIVSEDGTFREYKGKPELLYSTPEIFIGKTMIEILPKEVAVQYMSAIEWTIKTHEQSVIVYSLPLERSETFFEGRVLFFSEGLVALFIRDITERKKAEEDLLLFKTIVETSHEPIAIADSEGDLIYINPAHENLFGRSLEEAKKMNYREYYPPESVEVINNISTPALTRGESWEGELDVFDVNGRRFPLWERADSILDEEGKMIYAFALMHDISERKEAEEELVIKNYALNSSINAIAISDLTGNLTFINPSFLKMWGYSNETEILGKHSNSFWASEEKANQVILHLRNKHNWSGELIGKKKNGILFDVLLSASLVMDKDNNPICMMATFMDITERKRAEQLIIEENRKLKDLSEMKRDIITRVSHELKTPLTSIHGASYYLLNYYKGDMIEEVLEYLEIIHSGGLRLKSLVDDLIDISRLESGKLELKKIEVNITEIISDSFKDVNYFASHRNLLMKVDLPDKVIVHVDKIRIGQVITNILSNAIKNTPPYGEISVKLNESIDDIFIQVKDNGVGITREEGQSLFKKFGKIERYGKGMEVDTEGSGLGLFISKEIVELHNGNLFFESKGRNKGTIFTIKLPKSLL